MFVCRNRITKYSYFNCYTRGKNQPMFIDKLFTLKFLVLIKLVEILTYKMESIQIV